MGLLLAVLIVQVFGEGPVTPRGFAGPLWSTCSWEGMEFFYYLAALTIPHAFHWLEGRPPGDPDTLQRALTYFSYITLTTTGYGDITRPPP